MSLPQSLSEPSMRLESSMVIGWTQGSTVGRGLITGGISSGGGCAASPGKCDARVGERRTTRTLPRRTVKAWTAEANKHVCKVSEVGSPDTPSQEHRLHLVDPKRGHSSISLHKEKPLFMHRCAVRRRVDFRAGVGSGRLYSCAA